MKRLYYLIYILILTGIVSYWVYNTFYSKVEDTPFIFSHEIPQHDLEVNERRHQERIIKANQPGKFLQMMKSLRTQKGDKKSNYQIGYKQNELILNSSSSKNPYFDSLFWKENGPLNLSGTTFSVISDLNDSTQSSWFATTSSGDIWKTTNKGRKWFSITDSIPNVPITKIVQSKSKHNILYAITGETYGENFIVKGEGLIKSVDGGKNWHILNNTLKEKFQVINSIIIDPKNDKKVVISTTRQTENKKLICYILKSNDGGFTWNQVYESENIIQTLTYQPSNFNIILAGIKNKGVIKSINGGNTWGKVGNNFIMGGRINLAFAKINTSIVLCSTTGKGKKKGKLFVSMDAGTNWKRLYIDTPFEQIYGGQGWYNNFIEAHPYETYSFYIGGVNINKLSIKNFETGFSIIKPLSDAYSEYHGPNNYIQKTGLTVQKGLHPDHHQIQIINQKDSVFQMISANDGGIYVSDISKKPGEENNTWQFSSYGLHATHFYDIDKHPYQNQYIGGSQENGSWISPINPNYYSKYRRALPGDGFDLIWNKSNANKIIGSIYYNHFYLSKDGGYSFKELNNGLLDVDKDAPFYSKLANTSDRPNTLFTLGKSGVWFSEDFGESWFLSPIKNKWRLLKFMDIEISTANPDIIWAGAEMSNNFRIHVSTNGGKSFRPTSNFLYRGKEMGQVSKIVSDPIDSLSAYICFSFKGASKIIKTTDLGRTWKDISGYSDNKAKKLPDVEVYDLLVFPFNNDIIWAGTEIGIYETIDGGLSWHKLKSNFPPTAVWKIKLYQNKVIVSSQGRGIWSLILPSINTPSITTTYISKNNLHLEFDQPLNTYDSLQINIDGKKHSILPEQYIGNSLSIKNITKASTITPIAYKESLSYSGKSKKHTVYLNNNVVKHLHFDQNTNAVHELLSGDLFINNEADGFMNSLQSRHPYEINKTTFSYINKKIVISDSVSTINYKDVALINKDDFVNIQASKDLTHWKDIVTPYNSSINSDWLFTINKNDVKGAQNLEVLHSINLHDYFEAGDTINIRFKLNSTLSKNNWGWAITYFDVQGNHASEIPAINFDDIIPIQASVYPSVVKDQKINVEVLSNSDKLMNIKIMNLIGNKVLERQHIKLNKGWNNYPITLPTLTSGMYVINLEYENKITSLKFMISTESELPI